MTEAKSLPVGVYFYDYRPDPPILIMADNREYGFRIGHANTLHGVVGIYTQDARAGNEPATSLDFVAGGRCYRASWGRTFSDRFLKTLATRFAAHALEAARP